MVSTERERMGANRTFRSGKRQLSSSLLMPFLVNLSLCRLTIGAQSPIRINCGSLQPFIASDGKVWSRDEFYENGKVYTSESKISGSLDDYLYQSERWESKGYPNIRYNIPIENGNYTIKFLFAENYAPCMANDARVFDVFVENQNAFTMDIFKEAGGNGNRAVSKTYSAQVSDLALNIELKERVNNPKIGAIEIVPVGGAYDAAETTRTHPDIRHVAKVIGDDPDKLTWADSYSVGDKCYCSFSTFDHGIGTFYVKTPMGTWKTVKEICEMLGAGPGIKVAGQDPRPIYNDVQCGNGPPNEADDEHTCPGRVDIGPEGCGHIGPRWNFDEFQTTPDASQPVSRQSVFIDVGGPTDQTSLVTGTTWSYRGKSAMVITGNGDIDAEVFRTHRSSAESVKYTIGGFTPAKLYNVALGFAEVYVPNCYNDKRIMSIRINGNLYSNDLDVYKEAGCGVALVKTYVLGATSKGGIEVEIRASVESPMLSLIEINDKFDD